MKTWLSRRWQRGGSTSPRREMKSVSDLLGRASGSEVERFLEGMSDNAIAALPYLFEHWALPGHQLPPAGDWTTWVVLGGRGAGKTRTGSEWVRSRVEGATPLARGFARRVALVGETYDQVRDVMVMGDSGILACSPPDRRPDWQATKRKLVWPNGAEAQCFSASDPEALRGPQFDAAWCDELAKWKRAEEAWDMLQFCLRLGDDPRQVVTTTPKSVPVLRQILAAPSTVQTAAPTEANRVNLAEKFLETITAKYRDTRLGRQELAGELLTDVEGALWTHALLDRCRVAEAPDLDRIVVAVDPSVSGKTGGDACGIVVAGLKWAEDPADWRGFVLEDATVDSAAPHVWGAAVIDAARRYQADRVVAEVNQGGKLVEELLRGMDPFLPYRGVHAASKKGARAEPIAALYEQGRVAHVGAFARLEDQMCQMTLHGYLGKGSPDCADALVWALHELMLSAPVAPPRARLL